MLTVTWNVNSLRARLPRVLELLDLYRPEVVCLQETKCTVENFPVAELEEAGYSAHHQSAGQWAGVAILARQPRQLSDRAAGLPEDPVATEARWCEATVDGVRFVSTYVPNGRTLDSPEFPRKLAFLDAAAIRVGTIDGALMVAGDMNIAPADADVYDPAAFIGSTHVTAEERTRLAAILGQGLLDAYRPLHPTDVQFTWWDYRAGNFHRGLGLRIDLALLSTDLADHELSCGIDRDYRKGTKPSDHAPLLVELAP